MNSGGVDATITTNPLVDLGATDHRINPTGLNPAAGPTTKPCQKPKKICHWSLIHGSFQSKALNRFATSSSEVRRRQVAGGTPLESAHGLRQVPFQLCWLAPTCSSIMQPQQPRLALGPPPPHHSRLNAGPSPAAPPHQPLLLNTPPVITGHALHRCSTSFTHATFSACCML